MLLQHVRGWSVLSALHMAYLVTHKYTTVAAEIQACFGSKDQLSFQQSLEYPKTYLSQKILQNLTERMLFDPPGAAAGKCHAASKSAARVMSEECSQNLVETSQIGGPKRYEKGIPNKMIGETIYTTERMSCGILNAFTAIILIKLCTF